MVYAHFRKLPCAHRSSLLGDGSWIYYRNLALLSRFPFSFVLLVSNIAVSLQWNWRVRESPFAYGALHSESMDCFWEPSSLGSHTLDESGDLTSQQNSLRSPWKSAKDSKRTAIRVPMQKEDVQQANLVHRTNKLRLSQGHTLFHQEVHPSITLYGMPDRNPPLLGWLTFFSTFASSASDLSLIRRVESLGYLTTRWLS